MLYYDRTDASEGIDVNKTSAPKECEICHYQHFLYKGFNFQPYACNGCHDVLMMSMNISDIVILRLQDFDYHCVISRIIESEAINLMQNVDLIGKSGTL